MPQVILHYHQWQRGHHSSPLATSESQTLSLFPRTTPGTNNDSSGSIKAESETMIQEHTINQGEWGKSINYCNVRPDVGFSQRVCRRGGRWGTAPATRGKQGGENSDVPGRLGTIFFLDLCFMFSDYYRNIRPLYLKNQTLQYYIVTYNSYNHHFSLRIVINKTVFQFFLHIYSYTLITNNIFKNGIAPCRLLDMFFTSSSCLQYYSMSAHVHLPHFLAVSLYSTATDTNQCDFNR